MDAKPCSYFWDKASLHSHNRPEIHCIDQAGLKKLRYLPASVSRELGLKVTITKPGPAHSLIPHFSPPELQENQFVLLKATENSKSMCVFICLYLSICLFCLSVCLLVGCMCVWTSAFRSRSLRFICWGSSLLFLRLAGAKFPADPPYSSSQEFWDASSFLHKFGLQRSNLGHQASSYCWSISSTPKTTKFWCSHFITCFSKSRIIIYIYFWAGMVGSHYVTLTGLKLAM